MNVIPRLSMVLVLTLALSACVTIHIYFPAAAAEEAARSIVRDVLEHQGAPDAERPGPDPDAALEPAWRDAGAAKRLPLLARALERMVAPAAAQNMDLRVDTPAANRLRAAMRERHAQLAPHFRSGAIGFGRDGFVTVRDLSEVSLRERATVRQAVDEENADRRALYAEIARANGRPDWENQIRETFARIWIEEAPSGYWYQDPAGNWQQK